MKLNELRSLFIDEVIQRREEGCDVSSFEKIDIQNLGEDTILTLYKGLMKLEPSSDFPYIEPSCLDKIRKCRPDGPRRIELKLSKEELKDKILGAVLGRCAGCLLGKPVEGWKRKDIGLYLKLADKEVLDYYFPYIESDEEPFKRIKNVKSWTAGNITSMVRDDDIDYTIMGLNILEKYGKDFTTKDVAEEWLTHLPYMMVYTAEKVAYRNLVNGIEPPESALYMSPYREWIGAQIRADTFGYVNPGNPERAAEFAYRDASLSHIKNGIYGEMFISATIASAFVTMDIEEAINIGLSEIPKESRLYKAIKEVIRWGKEEKDWRKVWDRIVDKYGSYHPVHTINNACFVVLGLMHSGGDFEKAITISVMCGLDTDCNGATAGSIMGAILGAKNLPRKWIEPLNDTLESIVVGFNRIRISELAERIFKILD